MNNSQTKDNRQHKIGIPESRETRWVLWLPRFTTWSQGSGHNTGNWNQAWSGGSEPRGQLSELRKVKNESLQSRRAEWKK